MRWLDDIVDSIDMSLSRLQEIMKGREAWKPDNHDGVSTPLEADILECKVTWT